MSSILVFKVYKQRSPVVLQLVKIKFEHFAGQNPASVRKRVREDILELQSSPVLSLSLRCDLVFKRELDISGFGVCLTLHFSNFFLILEVRMALVVQTSIVIFFVIFGDNRELKRSFLRVNRVLRFTFLGVEVIQQGQISYYNLLILSHMGGLLSVPLLIEATSDPRYRTIGGSVWVEPVLPVLS